MSDAAIREEMRQIDRIHGSEEKLAKTKKPHLGTTEFGAFLELILAATYVPTHLRVQYHRPCEA